MGAQVAVIKMSEQEKIQLDVRLIRLMYKKKNQRHLNTFYAPQTIHRSTDSEKSRKIIYYYLTGKVCRAKTKLKVAKKYRPSSEEQETDKTKKPRNIDLNLSL